MTDLSNKIYQQCKVNYKQTLRKFRMIKTTPKDQCYMFLPLLKEEALKAWAEGIKRFEDGK